MGKILLILFYCVTLFCYRKAYTQQNTAYIFRHLNQSDGLLHPEIKSIVQDGKGYIWIFLAASLLGCYGGWALTKLLLDMIFKINAGVETSTLIGSVGVLFMITAIIIGIKVRQAIKANPVKLLRPE